MIFLSLFFGVQTARRKYIIKRLYIDMARDLMVKQAAVQTQMFGKWKRK